jgi:hypothetical protein
MIVKLQIFKPQAPLSLEDVFNDVSVVAVTSKDKGKVIPLQA